MTALEKGLIANPKQGINLGANLYKIRLSIKSKSKGKSSGYRIITYLVNDLADNLNINMLTLYDKSEESTIDKKYLLKLLGDID